MAEYQGGDASGVTQSVPAQAQEKVQATAQQASQKGAAYMRQQAEARAGEVSEELRSVAEALRRSGHALHADGKEASGGVVDNVTRTIERVSEYLGGTSADAMVRDVEAFGQRRPWRLVGIGLGIGVAAARVLKASSQARYRVSGQPAVPRAPRPALSPSPLEAPVAQVAYAGQGE
jgi:ElaB/YqjD/DUF883 family membrane-anchored ribosome-binding protein